ncbi:MAG: hypothetical protein FJ109_19245, partial [Deltaproteobacteria bacterium]|nr:hypothetical protein [Deltaproteobacteria bacterium]
FCEKWLCDAYSGKLQAIPLPDGTPCSDSDACTLNDQCQAGVCVKGKVVTAADCNDGNPCTKDWCDPELGCTHGPGAGSCDDKNPCTVGDACKLGSCVGEPKSCPSDGNVCTKDYCDPTSGCVYQPLTLGAGSCSDSNACTAGDFCKAGVCQGGSAVACDDKNPCTKDWCDPMIGCVNDPLTLPPVSCDDGNPCTSDDQCVFGKCKGFKPVDPDDGNPCTKDYCDPTSGIQHVPLTLAPGSCEDGKVCTLLDRCIDGKCVAGKPDAADDGNLCTEDLCAEGVGQIHIELSVDDGNPCTDDTCYPETGIVHVVNITGGNPCTQDFCNPSEGPFHVAVDDGTPCCDGDQCTVNQCQAGQCVIVGKTSCVDDKNDCTADYCDPAKGCVHEALDQACDDGDACTIGDWCSQGKCGGQKVNCDDNDPSTVDYCDQLFGCVHVSK